jgi:hypothetical protein
VTFLPSPLRGRARLALVLAALGMSVAVAGPAATEAKKGKPEKSQPPAQEAPPVAPAPAAPVEPSKPAQEPNSEHAKEKAEKPEKAAKELKEKRKPAEAPRNQPAVVTPEPAPVAPAAPTPQAPAAVQPESPATSPPATDRRLGTRGSVRERRASRRRAPGQTPTAIAGAVADTAATAFDNQPATPELDTRPAPDEAVNEDPNGGSPVTRTVEEIVEVVPESVAVALGGLLALSLVLAGASLLASARARRLDRQRHELLQEVGLLQTALLPPVPERLGALHTSVAYRPAEGPGAGGDFYDALPLPNGRVGFILGDVSGHGRTALERTAFLRYTLRAYLEAGLEPRVALQVAGRVIDEHLDGDFATVVLAVHDPDTASLTFACAGHPAPIVVGPSAYEPVLPGGSPPLGIGLRTGLRQTTIPLAPGSVACLFTDGVTEARTEHGILGRPRLGDIVGDLGRDADASELLERVAAEARLVTDDMAACVFAPTSGVTAGGFRSEELELSEGELGGNVTRRFLEACGVEGEAAARAEIEAADVARHFGGAVLKVSFGTAAPAVEVLPRNVESIEASSRRSAAS